MVRIAILIIILAFSYNARAEYRFTLWDKHLPEIKVSNVKISAIGPAASVLSISNTFFARIVLFDIVSHASKEKQYRKFEFNAESATLEEVISAVKNRFGYDLTTDEDTGILWLYPSNLSYLEILSEKFEIKTTHSGAPLYSTLIPMLSGIADNLCLDTRGNPSNKFMSVNLPVDIEAGYYSLRDFLNHVLSQTVGVGAIVRELHRPGVNLNSKYCLDLYALQSTQRDFPESLKLLWKLSTSETDELTLDILLDKLWHGSIDERYSARAILRNIDVTTYQSKNFSGNGGNNLFYILPKTLQLAAIPEQRLFGDSLKVIKRKLEYDENCLYELCTLLSFLMATSGDVSYLEDLDISRIENEISPVILQEIIMIINTHSNVRGYIKENKIKLLMSYVYTE